MSCRFESYRGHMPLKNRDEYNAYMSRKILERYHTRRAMAMERLGGKCAHCGTTENLEFDHIDRDTKSFPISKMWSVAEPRFLAELAKCQILCTPCHKAKTKAHRDYRKSMR